MRADWEHPPTKHSAFPLLSQPFQVFSVTVRFQELDGGSSAEQSCAIVDDRVSKCKYTEIISMVFILFFTQKAGDQTSIQVLAKRPRNSYPMWWQHIAPLLCNIWQSLRNPKLVQRRETNATKSYLTSEADLSAGSAGLPGTKRQRRLS